MEYDYLVFIGRFEPFHNGHAAEPDHARHTLFQRDLDKHLMRVIVQRYMEQE